MLGLFIWMGCEFVMIDIAGKIELFNPITKAHLSLPSVQTMPDYQDVFCGEIGQKLAIHRAVVLNVSQKNKVDDFVVMLTCFYRKNLVFARPGDKAWTPVITRSATRKQVADIFEWNGVVMIMNYDGTLCCCDITSASPVKARPYRPAPFFRPFTLVNEFFTTDLYMVELGGDLLVVIRHRVDTVLVNDAEYVIIHNQPLSIVLDDDESHKDDENEEIVQDHEFENVEGDQSESDESEGDEFVGDELVDDEFEDDIFEDDIFEDVESDEEYKLYKKFRERISYSTIDIKVVKLVKDEWNPDKKGNKWVEVKDLGDHVLFIGCNPAMSVHISKAPNCQRNCIYFTDDCEEGWYDGINGNDDKLRGHDVGMFDMATRKVKRFYERNDTISKLFLPIWFMPKF